MAQVHDRRRQHYGIDFDFYRAEARILHNEARTAACRKLWILMRTAVAYFKFPQKRWMRRQASSRSSVLVA